jgi:transposase
MGRPKQVEKRKQAFKLYRKYGNLSKVAEELGVSPSLITIWKKEDEWEDKTFQLQNLLKTKLTLKETSENVAILEKDEVTLGMLRELENIVTEKIYTGEVEPTTWNEIISTLRFTTEQKRLLLGQPTVRTEKTVSVEVQGLDDDELSKRIKETTRAIALIEPGED